MNQEATQDAMAAGGGSGSFGHPTGSTCTSSGTYRASNKYMDSIIVMSAGDPFPTFVDGRKTIWYPLTNLSTNKSGSFSSVKAEAGAI